MGVALEVARRRDHAGLGAPDECHFRAELVLLVRLALGDTAYLRLVKAVDLVLVALLLPNRPFVEFELFPVPFQFSLGQLALQFADHPPGNGGQLPPGGGRLLPALGVVAEVALAQQPLRYPNIALALGHFFPFRDLVALVDHLLAQLGIGGEGDVLLLGRAVDLHFLLVLGPLVQSHRGGKDGLEPIWADPLAEVDELRGVERLAPLEKLLSGEMLPIGVLDPTGHHALVALVEHPLEHQQAHNTARRYRWTARMAETRGHLPFDEIPVELPGQNGQRVGHVDQSVQAYVVHRELAGMYLFSQHGLQGFTLKLHISLRISI